MQCSRHFSVATVQVIRIRPHLLERLRLARNQYDVASTEQHVHLRHLVYFAVRLVEPTVRESRIQCSPLPSIENMRSFRKDSPFLRVFHSGPTDALPLGRKPPSDRLPIRIPWVVSPKKLLGPHVTYVLGYTGSLRPRFGLPGVRSPDIPILPSRLVIRRA